MSVYHWEGEYKMPDGREVSLEVVYSWGDPNTGIGAGVENVKAFDFDGDPINLTEAEAEAIAADTVLAERIEDKARDEYVNYMENRR